MERTVFSALHVSDFHFGADVDQVNIKTVLDHRRAHGGFEGLGRSLAGPHRQTVHDPDVAMAASRFILKNVAPNSIVLMSGDIAATGTDRDLRVGHSFLAGRAVAERVPFMTSEGSPSIAAGDYSVCLVPGNHDRYVDDLGHPGSTRFDQVFSDHWDGGCPVKVSVYAHATSRTRLAVVAADMCLPSDFEGIVPDLRRYGHGLAARETVDLMRRRTEELRGQDADVGVCWMVHFPPTLNPNDVDPSLSLLDGHRLEGAARSLGIDLIIAGHVHKSDVFARGRLQVVCAGSTTCSLEVHGNYIHHLQILVSTTGATRLHDRSSFRWSRSRGAFLACA